LDARDEDGGGQNEENEREVMCMDGTLVDFGPWGGEGGSVEAMH